MAIGQYSVLGSLPKKYFWKNYMNSGKLPGNITMPMKLWPRRYGMQPFFILFHIFPLSFSPSPFLRIDFRQNIMGISHNVLSKGLMFPYIWSKTSGGIFILGILSNKSAASTILWKFMSALYTSESEVQTHIYKNNTSLSIHCILYKW